MVGNAHIDPVWLWPWQEGYQEARATFRSAIERMDEYPDFVFTCNQVVLLDWVREQDPELFELIRSRVAEGRWQMAGGWWVEPDCNLPCGESFVRQGLYGQRFLKEHFGVTATVGLNADPFGHNVMLPQILRGQGMDSYCFLRPGPHESPLSATAFWWQSPDGSRVLAYRIPFEYCGPAGDVSGQAEKALGALDRSLGDVMIFYGVGNHGGGPTRDNIESIHRYDRMGSFGRMVMSSPRRYFDELKADGRAERLETWRGDLQMHAAGCYSAHSGVKLWQRRAQAAILCAERWAATGAAVYKLEYPREELARAWKQILFNQFHDILPGTAVESAYDDARDQLGEATAIAKRIINRTHNTIARQVDIPAEVGTQPVLVFNPHPWSVTSQIELQFSGQPHGVHVVDASGSPVVAQRIQSTATMSDQGRGAVAFEAALPPLGYSLFRLRPNTIAFPTTTPHATTTTTLHASTATLENDLLRATVDPETGWLTSLLDKRTGLDPIAGARGRHTLICEDPTDTWGHRVVSYRLPGQAMRTKRIVLAETGPLRARLRVEREWGRSTMVEELILGHGDDQIEVRVTLDWREPRHLLKLCFPTAFDDPSALYEVPFGALERPVDGGENPGQSWVRIAGVLNGHPAGLAVINNAKHGYDVCPASETGTPSIGITVVRSPVYAWHDPRRLDPDETYSHQDQGVQSFRYLLVPHAGDWREADLPRRAAELGSPPRAMLESFHPGTLAPQRAHADDGHGPVMVTAIKGGEDDTRDLIVRAVETTGLPAHARIDLPMIGRTITAEFTPYQIRTFRVPVDGGEIRPVDLNEWDLPAPTPRIPRQRRG